jgi:hypothetical protein
MCHFQQQDQAYRLVHDVKQCNNVRNRWTERENNGTTNNKETTQEETKAVERRTRKG